MVEIKDYGELKKNFMALKNEYRAVPFYHMDGTISNYEEVGTQLSGFKKSGYGGVVPLPVSETTPAFGTDSFYEAYEFLLEKAKKLGMKVIYYDDLDFPSGWAGGELEQKFPDSQSQILTMSEISCSSGETIKRKLSKDTLLSLVAMEIETLEIIDLRPFIVDGTSFVWNVPDGNWNILQFVCKPNPQAHYVNYLSYTDSMNFIQLTYKRFFDRFESYIGDVINMTFYDDICYRAENRRLWSHDFNAVFMEKYGFDPAPYYPALYFSIGEKTAYWKAMFMNCRAQMLVNGFFKAVSDFTKAHGLLSTGHVAEQKTTEASWLFGDGMLFQKLAGAPGLDLVHAYMYGFNGLKMVSSAAYNFDKEIVTCEIYGNYAKLTKDILYREAMNAFARGVNYLIPHTLWYSGKARIPHEVSHRSPEWKEMLPAWNDFVARVQTVLRGGRHICDIALLYPIYSLHSKVYLYEHTAGGFEFPQTPENADYMNVMNTVMNYSGKDVTVLHPEVFNERCYTEDGVLYLNNEKNFEQYRVLLLPGCSMISVQSLRIVQKFYESGGKIIATTELPFQAFEYSEDEANTKEVCAIIASVFGIHKDDKRSVKEYYKNTNANGGVAYFIHSASTALDGTEMVSSPLLDEILNSCGVAYDVEIDSIKKIESTGILNVDLPMFYRLKAPENLENSGVLNYIHKKYAGCDIYYVSNTRSIAYQGEIWLRGKLLPEEWNPHTGKIKKADYSYCTRNNQIYTKLEVLLESVNSLFFICREYSPTKGA